MGGDLYAPTALIPGWEAIFKQGLTRWQDARQSLSAPADRTNLETKSDKKSRPFGDGRRAVASALPSEVRNRESFM